jgi:polyphenol oxidase
MTDVGIAGVAAIGEVAHDPAAVVATSLRRTDRAGGANVSLVVGGGDARGARAELLGAVGLEPDDGVAMEQVHGGEVRVVGREDRGRGMHDHAAAVPGVDALVTFDTDVALLVMTADCVPVLLVDPGRGVAAVHAGRRGLVADVVGAAFAALDPPAPSEVAAVIGPAIGGCCYEVPAELADEVAARHPAAAARTRWGTPSLDLPAAVHARLAALGVGRIGRWEACTACDPDRWFSHRAAPGLGRQGAVVARRSEPGAPLPRAGTDPFLHWQP